MKPFWPDEPPDGDRPPGHVQELLYNRPSDTLVAITVGSEPPTQGLCKPWTYEAI
jgi:hypothetical protein